MADDIFKAEKPKFKAEQDSRQKFIALVKAHDETRFKRASHMAQKQLTALIGVGNAT